MDPVFKFNQYSLDIHYVPGLMLGTKTTKMRTEQIYQNVDNSQSSMVELNLHSVQFRKLNEMSFFPPQRKKEKEIVSPGARWTWKRVTQQSKYRVISRIIEGCSEMAQFPSRRIWIWYSTLEGRTDLKEKSSSVLDSRVLLIHVITNCLISLIYSFFPCHTGIMLSILFRFRIVERIKCENIY